MEGMAADIVALNGLLGELHSRYGEDESEQQQQSQAITPATMGSAVAPQVTRPIGQIKQVDPKAIWQLEEVPSDDEDDDSFETRTRPKFEILYKQNVGTEDVFLGLSDKDPSSAHCEAMVVRIECPRHRLEDIDLDVKRQKLLLQSSTLYVTFNGLIKRYFSTYVAY